MRFLILTLAFYTVSLFAQQPDSLKTKKWALGLTYSPDYCFRTAYAKESEKGSSNMTEKGKMGFTTGLNVRYQLMERIGVEFGVLYSTKGQKTNTASSYWLTPTEGYVIDPEKTTTYTYKYIEIPLKINVYLINKRLKVFPSIGCSANIFMGKKTHTSLKYEEGWKNETSTTYDAKNIPTSEFAILAGVGISYDLTKKLFVKVEPSFRSFVRPLVDYPVSGTFYSLGANTGVYLSF